MKLIKLRSAASRDDVIAMLANSELVNEKVRFDENKGRPVARIKENGKRIRIRCDMIGGATRDNGFLEGTYFLGTLTEGSTGTTLKGVILTAPIYHFVLFLFMVFYVYRCISLGGFNPLPIILLIFSILMFKSEFEKQGTIQRYLIRAFRRLDS